MKDVNKIIATLRDPDQAKYYHGDLNQDAAYVLQQLEGEKRFVEFWRKVYEASQRIEAIAKSMVTKPVTNQDLFVDMLNKEIETLDSLIAEIKDRNHG